MKKYILTVTLNPALDRVLLCASARQRDLKQPLKESVSAGGKGINVARTLQAFNVNVLSTGLLGGVNGERLCWLLNTEKLGTNFSMIGKQTRENLTYVTAQGRIIKRCVRQGPRTSQEETNQFVTLYKKLLKGATHVVLSGRKAHAAPDDIYAQLINLAHKKNVATFLDTHSKPLHQAIKARPDFIKPNLKEFESIVQKRITSIRMLKDHIYRLHDKGIKNILVSLDKHGCVGSDTKEMWHVKPAKTRIYNDVGCGDAFVGGFLYGLVTKRPFGVALQMATASGTANGVNITPGLTEKKIALQYLKNLTVEKL